MAADGMGVIIPYEGEVLSGPPEDERLTSLAIEQAFLAGMLCNPAAFDKLPETFTSAVFAYEDHAAVFDVAREAAETGAQFLSPVIESRLPKLGGPGGYVRQLVAGVVSARTPDLLLYSQELTDLAHRRILLTALEMARRDILVRPGEGVPTVAVVGQLMDQTEAIVGAQRVGKKSMTLGQAMGQAIVASQEAVARGDTLKGISTGFHSLDLYTRGLRRGGLYILAARPGMGKSALALQISIRAARDGKVVLYISLEMEGEELGERALSLLAGVDLDDILSGAWTESQWKSDAVLRARSESDDLPLEIVDEPGLTIQAIRLRIKAILRKYGRIDLMVIDHLHIMGKSASAARFGLTHAVTELSGGCKGLAKEFGIPVLALAQLSRALESREDKRPILSDLRESGSIEQDADAVAFVYRDAYYAEQKSEARRDEESDEKYQARLERQRAFAAQASDEAEVIFSKVRQGRKGTAKMRFVGRLTRFEEEGSRDAALRPAAWARQDEETVA